MQQLFVELVSNFNKALKEPNYELLCTVLGELRKLISEETQVPVDYFYTAGILPDIAKILDDHKISQEIQTEALWILINVASLTDQDTEYVAESLDGIERVLNVLRRTEDENVRDDVFTLYSRLASLTNNIYSLVHMALKQHRDHFSKISRYNPRLQYDRVYDSPTRYEDR